MDNFIVSARKYRPVTFESVVGQSHITSTLKNAISRSQLAHAYLFCGPRGVGKTTCARIFAKAINCTNPQNSEACGECESCRSFSEGRSFNIHELDAASNNSVDDIRALTEQVRIPPQVGKYSVYIIDEVHMLSAAAFNAFLKTLEEPPAHAIFILATTEKHKIIPTILSRCQIYDFNRIRVEDSVGYLKHIASQESVKVDDESLNLIAQKADGGMRDALSMFDKAVAFCGLELNFKDVARTLNVLDYDTYFTMTDLIGSGDYKSALTLFDEILKKGFSGLTFIAGLNIHFRDLLMCKDPATIHLLEVTGTLLERYKEQSTRYDAVFLFQGMSIISSVDNGFKTATNQRLHVELGLMKLCALAQKKSELVSDTASLPPLQRGGVPNAAQSAPQPTVQQPSQPQPTATQAQPAAPSVPEPSAPVENTVAQPIPEPMAPSVEPAAIPTQEAQAPVQEVAAPTPATSVLTPTPATAVPAVAPAAATEPAPQAAPQAPQQPIATPSPAVASPVTNDRGVSGISISDILKGAGTRNNTETQEPTVRLDEKIDPQAEEKILGAKDDFIEVLSNKRPMIAIAFENMTVSGNVISFTVASEVIKEEIIAHQKDVLGLLRRIGGVEGIIELDITIKEETSGIRPIRPEDKLEHLRAKNPLLDDLRRELNLEME